MTVEAIAAVGSIAAPGDIAPVASANQGGGFGDWFTQELGQVNRTLATAEQDVRQLATGQVENLHQVMIHLEEAKLSFQLLAQVRNHLLDAYQEVMRTQV
jgi:flagellar hook-basal body complex protein FliE